MITKIIEMHPSKMSLSSQPATFMKGRLRSFRYAFAGIRKFIETEKNAQVHLAAAAVVGILAMVFHVSRVEAIALVFAVALVLVTEMINTAIERAMDFITMDRHPYIKAIKDIAAGAVLVASICALLTGLFIFLPKILAL